jgi:outer membrane protein assembly factor BamB/fibronectin type 3 domain-containing protein
MKSIVVITIVFILLFPNLHGNITGTSMKNNNGKNNTEIISRDIIQNTSRSNGGLANSPWPMFGHDLKHTGRSLYNTSKNSGHIIWRFPTGGFVWSSPAIGSDGTIYVGSSDHNLYAINPNGTEKWNFTTGNFVDSSPAIGSDGTIYVGAGDDHLYAINPDGKEKWKFHTGNNVSSSPVINSDGTIYIASCDGHLYAINPDGTKKWSFFTYSSETSVPVIGSDNTIYFASFRNYLFAFNLNGTVKWNFTTGGIFGRSPAIGSDGTIYVGARDGNFYAIDPNGTKKWNSTIIVGDATPAIGSDGTIYIGSADGNFYAINPNGTKKWNSTIFMGGVQSSPAIGSDGTIYIGDSDGNFNAINPNGTKKWNVNISGGLQSSPAIGSDGTIYVGSSDGNLYAIGTAPSTAPLNLTAIGGNSLVNLTWRTPMNDSGKAITNYTIYRGTTSGSETLLVRIGIVLSYLDKNITNGQRYYYEVTASNSNIESPTSNEASAIPFAVPDAPSLTADAGKMIVTLSWTIPNSNGATILNYNIYRGTVSGGEILFVEGYPGGTSWADTNTTLGAKYYYLVSAVNIAGEGPKSNEQNATLAKTGNPPGVPTGLKATGGNAEVSLRWSAPIKGGAQVHYNIYRSDTRTGNYTLIATVNATGYKDKEVKNGHEYWYKINSQNSFGISGNTTAVSATPYGTSIISSLLLVIILVIIVVLILVEAIRSSRKKKV